MVVHHKGTYGMAVTLFLEGKGQPIDEDAYRTLIARATNKGRLKSIICGAASGEGPELNAGNMLRLFEIAKDAAADGTNVYVTLPWETSTAIEVCEKVMPLGCTGVMTLPETVSYAGNSVEQRFRDISAACGGQLMVYAKDVVAVPSDTVLARLAGDGVIIAVKRACDAVPFAATAKAVRGANPNVLVIQGAAERFVLGVLGVADGYTTGTGVVFPRLSAKIEAAFLNGRREQLDEALTMFEAMELMRAEHNTAYNIAPLKVTLQRHYAIGNGRTRPRFMNLLPTDVERLDRIAAPLVEAEGRE